MKPHPNAKITDGEIYGAPVPGGWPDRGPLQVIGDALGRFFGRRCQRTAPMSDTLPPATVPSRGVHNGRRMTPNNSGTFWSGQRLPLGPRGEAVSLVWSGSETSEFPHAVPDEQRAQRRQKEEPWCFGVKSEPHEQRCTDRADANRSNCRLKLAPPLNVPTL